LHGLVIISAFQPHPTPPSLSVMSIKVGINGFGRIGRLVLRCAARIPNIEVVGKSQSHSYSPPGSHPLY
jgi:lactate dehydrogenase-like 2-hydroxyacid dehydrogenase